MRNHSVPCLRHRACVSLLFAAHVADFANQHRIGIPPPITRVYANGQRLEIWISHLYAGSVTDVRFRNARAWRLLSIGGATLSGVGLMIARSWVRLPVRSLSNSYYYRMSDCLRTGKPSWYITNTKVNSAFHPSGVGKSSTGLFRYGWGGMHSAVSGAG